MSWYLANSKGMIDQFASISGLKALRSASSQKKELAEFFETGETSEVPACIKELLQIAKSHGNEDVANTARGLADLMHGQDSVSITQGFEPDNEDAA